jgi:hypothetical protein
MKPPTLASDAFGDRRVLVQLQLVRVSMLLTQRTLWPLQLKVPLQPLVTYISSRPTTQPKLVFAVHAAWLLWWIKRSGSHCPGGAGGGGGGGKPVHTASWKPCWQVPPPATNAVQASS